jgi:pyridoxal/pyridoxine/pyridoxamine kinase
VFRVHTLTHVRAVCDPVLGDEGRLYVPADLVGAYQEEILPIASVLVPNQVGWVRHCGIW